MRKINVAFGGVTYSGIGVQLSEVGLQVDTTIQVMYVAKSVT